MLWEPGRDCGDVKQPFPSEIGVTRDRCATFYTRVSALLQPQEAASSVVGSNRSLTSGSGNKHGQMVSPRAGVLELTDNYRARQKK